MTQTSSSVTSNLDSVFDGPAAPVTLSLHHSPVKSLKAAHSCHSLSEVAEWMEDCGVNVIKVRKDEGWRRGTGLMTKGDDEQAARLPGLSSFKPTSATSPNI